MKSSGLFIDTSGWGNLIDTSQPYHQLAKQIYQQAKQKNYQLMTSNYIITELVALLTSPLRLPRKQIISFIESIKTSPYITIAHIDNSLDQQAWQLLISREDKQWSLVDCSSFVLMRQENLLECLTNDIHFEQAGFTRLLK